MRRLISVEFAGEGSGEDELSWGQREIWHALVDQKTWMPIGGTLPLPAGHTLEDAVEQLRYLMSRYPSMRTRLKFEADGTPRQVVHASGTIGLEVVDAGDGDPLEAGQAVQRRYEETDLDLAAEWPVRMAVVEQHGTPTHLVAIMSHLVTDGGGSAVMLAESARRETAPVDGLQALEQVRWQRSPAGQRQSASAIRHWANTMRAIPLRRLAGDGDPQQPRYWRGELTSVALDLALRTLAARTQVDPAAIMQTVYAVTMARVGGVNPVATRLVTSNRFRPGLAAVVGPVSQTSLCSMDVAGQPFAEALDRVRRAAMTAHKYGYYDRARLEEVTAEVVRERGPELDLESFYNDRRGPLRPELVDPADIRAALPHTTMRWPIKRDEVYARIFLNVDDGTVFGSAGEVLLRIEIDTHHVSPALAEALLFGMEETAVAEATGP
ncbi:condensation domain-containing protein [Dactylosporangium sp. NPDC049742]|uniref:condensation domain-containing protein n=1 Tax=Dactylosporangium sp. NPDC049742 TaxID=3154737 RepID=UPI0034466E84